MHMYYTYTGHLIRVQYMYTCVSVHEYLGCIQDVEPFKTLKFRVRRLALIPISLLAVLKRFRCTDIHRYIHTVNGHTHAYTHSVYRDWKFISYFILKHLIYRTKLCTTAHIHVDSFQSQCITLCTPFPMSS